MNRSLLLLCFTSYLFLEIHSLTYAGGGRPPAPVQVAEVTETKLAPQAWVAGTVIGRYDAVLSAEVEGRIQVLAEVGDQVEQGKLMAQIDDAVFQIKLREAKAEIAPIAAKLNFYTRESGRLEALAQENNAAKNRLEEVISDRDEMQGELSIKQARLDQAKDTLIRTKIVAPFAGVVVERFKDEGEWAAVGEALLRLVNTATLEVQARIQQEGAALIKKGELLKITDGVQQVRAEVKTLVPVGDAVSRLYEVRLTLEQSQWEQSQWIAGHAVRVAVPIAIARQVIAVPRDALVVRENTTKVFRILDDSTAEAVLVRTGIADGDLIEVIGNLNVGDQVVVRGNERLRPKQPVTIQ